MVYRFFCCLGAPAGHLDQHFQSVTTRFVRERFSYLLYNLCSLNPGANPFFLFLAFWRCTWRFTAIGNLKYYRYIQPKCNHVRGPCGAYNCGRSTIGIGLLLLEPLWGHVLLNPHVGSLEKGPQMLSM